jgi:hypothetical protein
MPDAIQRKVLDKTYEANDLAKLKELVARFEAAIQTHDADVAAAQAALSAHASWMVSMHHFQHLHHFQLHYLLPVLQTATPTEEKATPTQIRNQGRCQGRVVAR